MIVAEMSTFHIPVMLDQVVKMLDVRQGMWYVDCNVGGGGHSEMILKKGGNVLGIDLDPDAINEVSSKLNEFIKSGKLKLVNSNFTLIQKAVRENNIIPSGILFDLGISTYQLEQESRGFSFNKDALLDMRMNQKINSAKAVDLINGLHEKELAELFEKLGEERFAKVIAREIVKERTHQPIITTKQLAELVKRILFFSKEKIHPATRIFQALRIAVNDELNNLKDSLPDAFELIKPGGKLVVICFHSLEDRIVKHFYKELVENGKGKLLTNKPIKPSLEEISANPKSRSAKLRAIEKN